MVLPTSRHIQTKEGLMVWYLLWKRRDGSKEMKTHRTLRDALAGAFHYLREGRKVVEIGEIGKGAVISVAEIERLFGSAAVVPFSDRPALGVGSQSTISHSSLASFEPTPARIGKR
jgi:hypothetical protein